MVKTPLNSSGNKRCLLSATAKSCKAKSQVDRFIPARSAIDVDLASYKLLKENDVTSSPTTSSPSKESSYKRLLAETLLADRDPARILAFKNKAPAPPTGHQSDMSLYSQNAGPRLARKCARHLPQAPDKILDAPDMLDDYYLNLLDWGTSNVVAVALNSSVYLWSAATGDTELLMSTSENEYISSVKWAADGNHVAVGTSSSEVQLWDANRVKQVRSLKGHAARVSALSWSRSTLSSGGRDSLVLNHDVRRDQSAAWSGKACPPCRRKEHLTATLRGHQQEVCGLAWSPSGDQLASGGNDNLLHIWAADGQRPQHRLTAHQAAVKALAWCPFQSNLLASGGGTADRCIRFWNTITGAQLNSIDTASQVCALQWNTHEREILSSHGFSQNQLCLWKYPSMVKIGEFSGHTSRVLHLAQSPDGTSVCSAAADETLRFWRVFGEPAKLLKSKAQQAERSSLLRTIR